MPRPKSETTMIKHSFSIESDALEYYKEVAWLNRTSLSALVRAALAAYVPTLPKKPESTPEILKVIE